MATVFISYNRNSQAITKTLAEDITALGHSVWFDQKISGGQAWWDQILSKIRESDIFVFVLEPEALNSTACKREYGYAADIGKPILPVLASSEVSTNLLPTALSQIQFIDYRKSDRNAALSLARAFATIPPPMALPDPLPTPPEAPISYLGSLTELVESTDTLSYEKQTALLLDLKRGMRDRATALDVRVLLEKYRKRHDLFASVADEIDDIINDDIGVEPNFSKPQETKQTGGDEQKSPPTKDKSDALKRSVAASNRQLAPKDRLVGGFIFGLLFAVVNVFIGTIITQGSYLYWAIENPAFYIVILGGFVVGLISWKNQKGMIAGAIGMSPMLFAPYQILWGLAGAVLAIVGSIIGVQLSKKKARNVM